jgi:hypothetical protein
LLDTQTGLWPDHWTSCGVGVVAPPPMRGTFDGGVGTFIATDDGMAARCTW